jgi:uncharacterized protein (DUF302 family)
MNSPYAFTIELAQPLKAAVETLREALGAEQMGIVSEVDVQSTLRNTLGLNTHPQRLLGICSPKVAYMLVMTEPDIAALLPCGCGVAEPTPGRTRITVQDPRIIATATDNVDVRAACEIAHAALRRVADRLVASS